MRFEVHQSHRLEDLLARLEARLGTDPLPPLQWETILVPAQGLARWVQLRLAERAGIAAGIRLPFLGGFLQDLCHRATAGGEPGSEPGADPFARETLVWRLWRLLGNQALQAELGPAAAYVADDPDGSKRFQLCTRLAACFDDYQLYRSDLLLGFARGQEPKKLPHAGWQAQLWRALLRDAGGEPVAPPRPRKTRTKAPVDAPWLFPELAAKPAPTDVPPAHRLERLRELLRDPLRAKALLPRRLSVFGAQTLPPAFLRLLQQMAMHVPVDLYVPLPTAHYIGDLRARGERSTDHPLLAGWGTEAREFADLLADLEDGAEGTVPLRRADDADADEGDADDTMAPPPKLLACLQQDIRNVTDRAARGGPGKLRLARDDDSLRVHDCHSPQRELEVVRDQILARFETDPTLQPHDVLVLVPDIDRYAPYAHAVFGPVAEHLPFHVADRNPARDLPICKALLELLHLASSRLRTFDVLHLLEEPSLRRRFGLVASDLPLLRSACERAGIRWGLDGVSRQQQHGVPAFEENSWRLGLDRLVLGAATGPGDQLVAGLLPTADTTESRLVLLDRFVTFAETLFARLAVLRSPWPLVEWSRLLDALLEDFFAPEGAADDVAVAHLHKATAALRTMATTARCDEAIPPVVLRDWLLGALHQGSGSRGFLAGAVTVAAMLPMRTVPARCLFVCGLDDASFPRRDTPAPFDLIAAERRPGDRSRRLDDRQMFLDVLLAAREHLHLTFVGHSAKDDAACAPSVVLAELLEHVDRTCEPPPGFDTAREFVVVRQPLQPWSRRYRSDREPRLFTFTRQGKGAHVAPVPERPWHPEVAPPAAIAGVQEIRLADLLDFWNNPSRHFVRQTMQVSLPRDKDRDDENEPFALHNLDKYHLQDSALDRALRGEALRADAYALARAEGLLPVGGHGEAVFADLAAQTERFLRIALAHHAKGSRSVVARGRDFVVTGEVEGLGPDELVRIRTANMKPRDKLKAWLLHLVLAVARHQGASDLPCRTRVIALDEVRLAAPLDLDTAGEHLAVLIAGYRSGLLAPLPFFENSSHAYGTALHKSPDRTAALRKARGKWEPADQAEGRHTHDDLDGDVQLCMRGRDPIEEGRFRDLAAAIWTVAESHLYEVAEDHKA